EAARDTGVGLPKAIKYERLEFGLDADAAVLDGDLDVRVDALERHAHAPALGGELDRIGEQIPQRLLQPMRIAADRTDLGVEQRLDSDLLAVGGGPDGVERRVDYLMQAHGPHLEQRLARDDA